MSYLLWIFTFSTKKKKKSDTHSYTHTNMHTCNYTEKGKIREERKTRNPKLQPQTIFKNWRASITKPEILISDLLIYKMKCVCAESFPQAQTLPGGYLRLRRFCDFFQKLVSSNFMYRADYSQGYCITVLLMWLFSHQVILTSLQPHGLPCPSPSPRVCPSSCPLSWWYHPTISFSVTLSEKSLVMLFFYCGKWFASFYE